MREHLRACGGCRATLRAYRAAPGAAAALAPALPLSRSLFERAHDTLAGVAARFGGGGSGDSALSQVAASGGTRGAGVAALAKVAAICVGTAGGAAACVAAGVVPAPLAIGDPHPKAPAIERRLDRVAVAEWDAEAGPVYESAPEPEPEPNLEPAGDSSPKSHASPAAAEIQPPATSSGAVEYAPEPEPTAPVPAPESAGAPATSGSGSAAGEFSP